ncbi:MAG: putative peptidoglycan glycosyltransferase FtsW, partial [Desulfobacterales bacterium]
MKKKDHSPRGKRQTDEIDSSAMPYDMALLFPVLFLVGIGIVMVYSASSALAREALKPEYFFLKKQMFFGMAGVVVLVVFRHFPFQWFRALAYPILVVAIGLLIATQVPGLGIKAGGATRWIRVAGVSFQPSEVARFAMVVYLAYSLSKKKENVRTFSIGFFPHMVVLGILVFLILMQPDFGSVAILCMITWLMLFIGGVPIFHLSSTCIVALPVVYFIIANAEYRLKRITGFLDPWQYPTDEGYQIIHSLMAFGSGGIWGAGIGKSYQKLFYLPEPHTDFIFSVVGEELGLVGVAVILGLYALI